MSAAKQVEYKPPPEFEEVDKDPLIELNLTDSTELWLVQWPINQVILFTLDSNWFYSLNMRLNHFQVPYMK